MGYRAFFSYSRADDRLANWLHRALDSYRTPKTLVGARGAFGPIPERLHPIFRDRTDMAGGGELTARFREALEQSEALIVLCSPEAAKSPWVNLEVETFIALGKADRIFPVIAAGEPESSDPEQECFPPALRGRGVLAADIRDIKTAHGQRIGDGRDVGRLKLIAGLLGAPLDQLIQRERRRQRTLAAVLAGATIVFALVAGAAVFQTVEAQRNLAAAEREAAIGLAQQSAQAISDGDLPGGFVIAADGIDRYPTHAERFLSQLRWIAFATREYQALHQGRNGVDEADISPDERWLASINSGSTLAVTDLQTGRTWTAAKVEGMNFVGIAVGDHAVAAGLSNTRLADRRTTGLVQIRRLSDGALLSSFEATAVEDIQGDGTMETTGIPPGTVRMTAAGDKVAICDSATVSMYNANGQLLWRSAYLGFNPEASAGDCAFNNDGTRLAAVLDIGIKFLFDASNGELLMRQSPNPDYVSDIEGPYYEAATSEVFELSEGARPILFEPCNTTENERDILERFFRWSRNSELPIAPGHQLQTSAYDYVAFWPRTVSQCGRFRADLYEVEERVINLERIETQSDIQAASTADNRLEVRLPGTAQPSIIRTRGTISYVTMTPDASLVFVEAEGSTEVWDGRHGLLLARIENTAEDDSYLRVDLATASSVVVRVTASDWADYEFATPEFSQDAGTLIATLCPRLFGATLPGAARPRLCGPGTEITRVAP